MTNERKLEMLDSIIECFEELLDSYCIELPNKEKEESDDLNCCSNIYGTDYGNLENRIEDILIYYELLKENE